MWLVTKADKTTVSTRRPVGAMCQRLAGEKLARIGWPGWSIRRR